MLKKEEALSLIKNDEILSYMDEESVNMIVDTIMESVKNDTEIDKFYYEMAEKLLKTLIYYCNTLKDHGKISKYLEILKDVESKKVNIADLKRIIKEHLDFENPGRIYYDSVFIMPNQAIENVIKLTIRILENIL